MSYQKNKFKTQKYVRYRFQFIRFTDNVKVLRRNYSI